jgi:hypothetical protein
LFVAKGYMPISIVKNQWLKHLVMDQNPWVVFATKTNGLTCYPFIGGQNHGTIRDNFGFLCL